SGDEGGTGESNLIAGVLDTMAEQMDALQAMFMETARGRSEVDEKLSRLVDTIEEMNRRQDDVASISGALERVAVGQETIAELMRAHGDVGIDAESRMRLRSIDVQMLRILEEISAGRQESLAELRKDIDLLVKAFASPRGADRAATRGTPRGEG
ncbi:MAG: biopolymer transporter ExbB, partial [Bradyrhizobium sp.]|nr:biopolymer transporter ExbB [Bradyrhizobium sp.]